MTTSPAYLDSSHVPRPTPSGGEPACRPRRPATTSPPGPPRTSPPLRSLVADPGLPPPAVLLDRERFVDQRRDGARSHHHPPPHHRVRSGRHPPDRSGRGPAARAVPGPGLTRPTPAPRHAPRSGPRACPIRSGPRATTSTWAPACRAAPVRADRPIPGAWPSTPSSGSTACAPSRSAGATSSPTATPRPPRRRPAAPRP
jgi:hypothetical protein